MIEMPKEYKTATITASSPKSSIRFNTISDEEKAVQVERRLSPTRRRSDESSSPIERRTSSDRRRPSFSEKA